LRGTGVAHDYREGDLKENEMYQKPRVLRFGTLRELTLDGFSGPDCDAGPPTEWEATGRAVRLLQPGNAEVPVK
jgi:hypothetical protein